MHFLSVSLICTPSRYFTTPEFVCHKRYGTPNAAVGAAVNQAPGRKRKRASMLSLGQLCEFQ